ncbi:MAG TPA: DUF1232 domain-containing protein [Euzebyales bacterium]|nr:DUF1232 domain-containing protein [Euzebyales bacterium]
MDQRAADRVLGDPVTAIVFVRDLLLLFKDCAFDARVPRRDKWVLAAVVAYVLSPVDLIPDVIPIVGQVDDLSIAVLGLRRLLRGAGRGVVEDLWRGTDDGLALLFSAAGMTTWKDTA